jgi:hypothetical protein
LFLCDIKLMITKNQSPWPGGQAGFAGLGAQSLPPQKARDI